MLWRMLWRLNPLLLALMVGCASTPRVSRVELSQGQAVIHLPSAVELPPVPVEEEEFQQAVRTLARYVPLTGSPRQTAERTFQMDPLSGKYFYLPRDKKLVPAAAGEAWDGTLTREDRETAERFRLWCRDVHHFYGDCLGGALVGGSYLDAQGRYMWALSLSKSPVLEELEKALGEMVNPQQLINTVLWTLGSLLLILALNPVAGGLVALLGVGLILYVGYSTLYRLVAGWGELMLAAKDATTFEQIREAGERFGKLLGREAAHAFAMLLLAAIGQTAQGFAATLPTLPGSAQMAVQSEAQVGLSVAALAEVQEIELAAEGVSITLPANAVAMGARGVNGGEGPCVETHHIATICNDTSTQRGGPWTPRFRNLFAKAGMSLDDPANKLPLEGHFGPHPRQYHELVLKTLDDATRTCRSVVDCRAKLTWALKELSRQIATSGTELNQLVTRQPPR